MRTYGDQHQSPLQLVSNTFYSFLMTSPDTLGRIYEVHTKDQVLPIFIQFKALVEKQFNLPIKHLQSDNEGKFKALIAFLAQHGIQQRLSCPYTP